MPGQADPMDNSWWSNLPEWVKAGESLLGVSGLGATHRVYFKKIGRVSNLINSISVYSQNI